MCALLISAQQLHSLSTKFHKWKNIRSTHEKVQTLGCDMLRVLQSLKYTCRHRKKKAKWKVQELNSVQAVSKLCSSTISSEVVCQQNVSWPSFKPSSNLWLITLWLNTSHHNLSHVKESILAHVPIKKVHPAFDRNLCEYGVREDNDAVNSSQKQLAAQQKKQARQWPALLPSLLLCWKDIKAIKSVLPHDCP